MGTLLSILGVMILCSPIIIVIAIYAVLVSLEKKALKIMEQELEEENELKEEIRKLTKREKKQLIKMVIEELESE